MDGMEPAGRGGSRARREGRSGGGLEDLRIRLSRKYNEFNLAEAFDPRRTDNTATTEASGVARPTSIDSALFPLPVPGKN